MLQQVPFRHLTVQQPLNHDFAEAVLQGLCERVTWKLKEANFYSHYGVDLDKYREDSAFRPLFEPATVAPVLALVETAFQVCLDRSFLLWGHKLEEGQGIGPHNDNEPSEFRFVLQLGIRAPSPAMGYLVLFDHGGTSHRVYPPLHNTAVCFNTNATSYHGVTEVSGATRFSVIYVFRTASDAHG